MTPLSGPLYVVVGVLAVAGLAKAVSPLPTATALRRLRIPRPVAAARLLGLAELVIAIGAVAVGTPLTWALVAACYAAFTGFVLWALQSPEPLGSCGCFGRDDTPPTLGHAAFNAAATALAVLAAFDPIRPADLDLGAGLGVVFVALVGLGIGGSVLALTSLPRLLALARGDAPVTVRQFSVDGAHREATTPR